jgi:HSP20 family protein
MPSFQKIEIEEQISTDEPTEEIRAESWLEPDGELAIDVYQTDADIVIQSAVAGVRPEELDISVENDVVTIKGIRKNPNEQEEKNYLHEECYWGPFSRQVFLPEDVNVKMAEAAMKDGILTLRLHKVEREKAKKVSVTKE